MERSSEEEDEDWVTEEIVDVEHNKVYTREVAIWAAQTAFLLENTDCAGFADCGVRRGGHGPKFRYIL